MCHTPLGEDSVLRYQIKVMCSNVDCFRNIILEDAHAFRYSIHLGSTKMYHNLRDVLLSEGLKKEKAEFVAKCPNCK